jgi:hypothetical protein
MATTADAQQRIASALETASLMLADLDEIAGEWESLAEHERVSWSLDWSNEMSGLEHIAGEFASGSVSPSHERSYLSIMSRLAAARPTAERLGLYLPAIATAQ